MKIHGWVANFDAKSGYWIGVNDAMGLTASGLTKDELEATVREATRLLHESLVADGELDEFLAARGLCAFPDCLSVNYAKE